MSYSALGADTLGPNDVMMTVALAHCISSGGDPSSCVDHFGGDPESAINRDTAIAGCIGSGGDPLRCGEMPYNVAPGEDKVMCNVALAHCMSAGGDPSSCVQIFPCDDPESYIDRQVAIAGCMGAGGDPTSCSDLAPTVPEVTPPSTTPPTFKRVSEGPSLGLVLGVAAVVGVGAYLVLR